LALSFSVVALLQDDPVAPGLTLEGAVGKAWLEGLVSAGVSSERQVSLGPGTASWSTARLRLGAAARLVGRDGGWQLKLAGGGGAASVDAHGNGFATTQDASRISTAVWEDCVSGFRCGGHSASSRPRTSPAGSSASISPPKIQPPFMNCRGSRWS
jgi:hypothetical protein